MNMPLQQNDYVHGKFLREFFGVARFLTAFIAVAVVLMCFSFPAYAYGVTREMKYPQVIAPDQFESLVLDHIDEVMAATGDGRRYTAEVVHIPRDMRAPEGELSFSVTTPNGVRFYGNTATYFEIFVDGVSFRKISCQVRIHIYDNICVAAKPIQPNVPISSDDIRMEEREIGTRGKNYFFSKDDAVGKVVMRSVNIGQPLLQSMLKWPVIIEPGAPIVIMTNMNGVMVKMDGMALESGRLHERIRVRNNSSRRVVLGRVVDANTVEVENKS